MRLWFFLSALLAVAAPAWAGHEEPVGCAQLPALTGNVASATGSCTTAIGTVPSGATIQDAIHQQFLVSTSELDKTSNTTLADITGLQQTLTAGKTYNCYGHLSISAGSSGGAKFAIVANPAGLTVTSISYRGRVMSGTTISANTTATTIATAIGATAAVTDIDIDAGIVVNAGGTLSVQGAQNVSNATTTKFLINSTFRCMRVN